MVKFESKWETFSPETRNYGGAKSAKPPSTEINPGETYEKRGDKSDKRVGLVLRLRAGSVWLAKQHAAWINDEPVAATAEEFSKALAAWDAMERVFRCTGYEGCIFGRGRTCPKDGPASCAACAGPGSTRGRIHRLGK